jgi:RND family efflux transporter MFP subunit
MKKIKRKYIIIGAAVLIILFFVFRNGKTEENFITVERQDIVQELYETGTIEKGENIVLSFREGGRIERIVVQEGQRIKKGEIIAVTETEELKISLKEAQAGLVSAIAGMQRFLAGATSEELGVIGVTVESAEANLSSAKESLKEQERIVGQTLDKTYQGVVTLTGDVFSTVKEVDIGTTRMSSDYFSSVSTIETKSGRANRDIINRSVEEIGRRKDSVADQDFAGKKNSLEQTRDETRKIVLALDNLVKLSESNSFRNRFSEADSSLLREYLRLANLKHGEVVSFLGTISSVEAETDLTLTVARNNVVSAENALSQTQKESSRVQANPELTEVQVKQAVVDQAKARVDLLQKKINDSQLKSPVDGIVSTISVRAGETVAPISPVTVIAPENDVQVKLSVYEGDIPKVSVGNQASVSFVAFPQESYQGEVVSINPVGVVKDGVVYYEIVLIVDQYPEKALIGMTVDVTVTTNKKENVLAIPERAVFRENNESFVMVSKKEKRKVELGLQGQSRMVEVVSGLEQGEKVLID